MMLSVVLDDAECKPTSVVPPEPGIVCQCAQSLLADSTYWFRPSLRYTMWCHQHDNLWLLAYGQAHM